MWDHRNQVLHAPGGPAAQREAEELAEKISEELETGPGQTASHLHYLWNTSLEELQEKDLNSRKRWLGLVQAARAFRPSEENQASRQHKKQQALMRRWLRSEPEEQE